MYVAPTSVLDEDTGNLITFDLVTTLYALGSGQVLAKAGTAAQTILATLALVTLEEHPTFGHLLPKDPAGIIEAATALVANGLIMEDEDGRGYLLDPEHGEGALISAETLKLANLLSESGFESFLKMVAWPQLNGDFVDPVIPSQEVAVTIGDADATAVLGELEGAGLAHANSDGSVTLIDHGRYVPLEAVT